MLKEGGMTNKSVIVMASLVAGVLFVMAMHTVGARDAARSKKYSTYQQLKKAYDKGQVLIVDVRTKWEYEQGAIPKALNIPHGAIADKLQLLPKHKEIVLYCRSGNRSGQALETLQRLGYTKVHNFGGIYRWKGPLQKAAD